MRCPHCKKNSWLMIAGVYLCPRCEKIPLECRVFAERAAALVKRWSGV